MDWSSTKFAYEMLKQSLLWRYLVLGFLSGFVFAFAFALFLAKGAVAFLGL